MKRDNLVHSVNLEHLDKLAWINEIHFGYWIEGTYSNKISMIFIIFTLNNGLTYYHNTFGSHMCVFQRNECCDNMSITPNASLKITVID
jgi:hypothetical protein